MYKIAVLILVGFVLFISELRGQYAENYLPRWVSSPASESMMNKIRYLKPEKRSASGLKIGEFNSINQRLINGIEAGVYFDDSSIIKSVDSVLTFLKENYSINRKVTSSLIHRSPAVNAYCLGQGSIIVTNGLLSKLDTKEQLAFVLAHELAHLELGHHAKKRAIRTYTQNNNNNNSKTTIDVQFMETFKQAAYESFKYSRKAEFEADSLGLIIYFSSYSELNAPIQVLNKLDSANLTNTPLNKFLVKDLHFKAFPFNEGWLKNDLSYFRKRKDKIFFMDVDSLLSHPDVSLRIGKIQKSISSIEVRDSTTTAHNLKLKQSALFENVISAIHFKKYDIGLYQALQLKSAYPDNRLLVTLLTEILSDVHDLKRDDLFKFYFSKFTFGYEKELQMINNFLRNIHHDDIIVMAYYFLTKRSNFNANEKQHYLLLKEIYERTVKKEELVLLKTAFVEKFGEFM